MNSKEKLESGLGCARSASLSAGKFARPGSKPSYGPDQSFDAQHIRLELTLDVPGRTVQGLCTTTLRSIHDAAREIVFDAVRMRVLSVSAGDGVPLRYSYNKEKITVRLPKAVPESEAVTVAIAYRLVRPTAGVYFIAPDRDYPKKPVQVWTHGEAEESRHWFPCFDAPHDKATTEMIATVPRDFFALSNGALVSAEENAARRTKTYHWRQEIPHSPYLVTLVAGKFAEVRDEWDGIPVLYYCQPGRQGEVRRAFGKTPRMIEFFSNAIGVRYPYEKYAQIAVTDFVMGGMEHTTATTQTDRVLMDARAYPEFTADWLCSHELAHQWFGDLLTCKEWSHAWLNESFATYFEALFTEHDLGADEFRYEMYDKLQLYLEEDRENYRRPIVTAVYRKPDDLFDRHLYEKGSLVLHLLRHLLGDALFWKAVHHYVVLHQGRAVETQDLINAIQESTGRNFRRLFDQFVFGAGHPEYTVHYWWDEKARQARLRVLQRPVDGGNYFSLPVRIEFITDRGPRAFTETLDQKEHSFKYRFPREPKDVRLDPQHGLLKTVSFSKPYRMWAEQLRSDPHVVGRIQAAKQIARVQTEESVRILIRAFNREKFWGSAKEIAAALGTTRLGSARAFLLRAATSERRPKVRRGVVEGLSQFSDPEALSKLESVYRRDPSYFVASEALKGLSSHAGRRSESALAHAWRRPSWNDTVRSAALLALTKRPTRSALATIKNASRYGESLSVRAASVQAMARLASAFPELFPVLIGLTRDKQIRIRQAAINALGHLKDPRAVPTLERISKDKDAPFRTPALAEDALLKINPSRNGG